MGQLIYFFKAIYTAIVVLFLVSLIMMPLRVWKDSFAYISQLYEKENFIKQFLNSELKVISWINLLLTCLIFLMYPIGLIVIVSLFFKGFELNSILNKMFFLFMVSYFGPLFLALIKELVTLALLKYFKLETIADILK